MNVRIFANFRRGMHLYNCHPAVTWNAPNTLVRCKSVCMVVIVSWTIRSDIGTFYLLVQLIVPLLFLPLPLIPFASNLFFPVPFLVSSAYYLSYSTSRLLVFCSLSWSTHYCVPDPKALNSTGCQCSVLQSGLTLTVFCSKLICLRLMRLIARK